MSRDIVEAIDHALSDWEISPDAMRWAPDLEQPQRLTHPRGYGHHTVTIALDTSAFDAAFRRAAEAFADWVENVNWPRVQALLAEVDAARAAERASAMRAEYDRRRRARNRRKR